MRYVPTAAVLLARGLVSLFLSSVFTINSPAQSPVPQTQSQDQSELQFTEKLRSQPPPVATDHEQIVAYWTSETGWKSELQLRNNHRSQDLTVTPALRLPDGAETSLAAVTVKPQEVNMIDLDAAIAAAGAPQLGGTFGSIVLRYRSEGYRNLYAALMIRNVGHPFAFHIDAIGESEEYQSGGREGVWWLPTDTANDYLVVTNQGKNTIQAALSLYDASGRESKQKILLGAHETTRYSVRKLLQTAQLSGFYGGIKISASSHSGSLDTVHFIYDEKAAFSAILKMFDHDPNSQLQERDFAKTGAWTLRAPMLALSSPDPALAFPPGTTLRPQLFIRNTTDRAVSVALRFNWRDAKQTGSATGPLLRLNRYETRLVDVRALQNAGTLPEQANWASVTLTTDGPPDEVMAVAASYDETFHYGAQTPFSDQLNFRWEGGMWEYDTYHSSIMTAGNGGTKPMRAALTIFYNQGTEKYELEQTLKPDEQMWVDVGKLIRERVPDKNGKTLPADLTMGSYEFRDLTDTIVGSLFEGKVIYDKTYGHVSYGCASCCGYRGPQLIFNPLGIPFSGGSPNGVEASDACWGGYANISTNFYGNWSTASTAIATVNTYGSHSGMGVGSTTSQTSGIYTYQGLRYCPGLSATPGGGDNVNPTLSLNVANPYAFVGSDPTIPQVLMQAIGNPSGGNYSWTASPTNRVSFNNPNTDVVQVKGINPSSSLSDTTLTVTYNVGGVSATPATVNITVRVFELLSPDSPTAVITPQPNGFLAFVYYNVVTGPAKQTVQPGYSGIAVTENVTVDSATLNGTPLTPQQLAAITTYQGPGATDANTQVGDDQRLLTKDGSALPSGLVISLSQDLFVGGFYVRSNGIQKASSPQAVTITNRGPVIP